jgi:hypothetical protein
VRNSLKAMRQTVTDTRPTERRRRHRRQLSRIATAIGLLMVSGAAGLTARVFAGMG